MWVRACADADGRTRREITSYATARPYARHFTALGYGAMVDQVQRLRSQGRLREAPALIPQELLDLLYVDVDDVRARGRAYAAVGATPVVMPVTGDDPRHDVTRLLERL